MRVRVSPLVVGIVLCALLAGIPVNAKTGEEADTAELLITLVNIGRAIVSEHQTLVNDAAQGNKEFTDDFVRRTIVEQFLAEARIDSSRPSGHSQHEIFLAMLQSEREVILDAQPAINKQGIAFKGFIPSLFARKAGQKLFAKTGITVKLTSLDSRYSGHQPDDFEVEVLRLFADPRHPKGQRYAKVTVVNGKPAMRVMSPEYADAPCLVCHGSPEGKQDAMGMKKEGWMEGGPAGAISVVAPIR